MADLTDRQFELDGFVFGHKAPSGVAVTAVDFGAPEARSADVDRPRADGVRFGREWRSGRRITLELATLATDDDVTTDLGRLCAAWDAASVRQSPGSLSVLRYHVNGRTRRVYGRPRQIEHNTAEYKWGKVLITAVFDTEGPYFYADEPVSTTIGLAPSVTGGFVFPLSFPASTIGMGERRSGLEVPGLVETPVVLTIYGPISHPIVEIDGQWRFEMLTDLLSDQSITIDTRPWAMSARRNDGLNLAGQISTLSPRMRDMWLPPGTYDVILRGHDLTGSARLDIDAWAAFASF